MVKKATRPTKTIFSYKRVDWDAVCENFIQSQQLDSDDGDAVYESLVATLENLKEKFATKITVKGPKKTKGIQTIF